MSKNLRCQMWSTCKNPVSHIDNKGYVYCEDHGSVRAYNRPCRKLTATELKRLNDGSTIKYAAHTK